MNECEPSDVEAVAAVKQGESERYRDLVERYERKVYAVAWARLGDSDLAEEAVQETFIKGYRKLALLNEDNRFGAWILAIARNVSINLGLRRRHEWVKRERWAILQEPEDRASNVEEPVSGQTLQDALKDLPAPHRECLVMFYLEGKCVAEAAALLALSESAFKTRLHRARAALRQRLESHLEGSLERLRPSKPLAPAIMVLVTGQSMEAVGAAGGLGLLAKWGAAPLKLLPFQFLMAAMLVLAIVPAYLLARLERGNYRDRDGFRARYFQTALRRGLVFTLIVAALVWLATTGVTGLWGSEAYRGLLGLFLLLALVPCARLLAINRNRMIVGTLAALATLGAGWAAVYWFGLPQPVFNLFFAGFFGWNAWAFRDLPLRMDYSLFLRLHQGLISEPPAAPARTDDAQSTPSQVDRRDRFQFARFLGERWLVADFRASPGLLRLRLAPVQAGFTVSLFPWIWRNCSIIGLSASGPVKASLGAADARKLRDLGPRVADPMELERGVAQAVEAAWAAFCRGYKVQPSR